MVYKNRERVSIHSLGSSNPGIFRATVVGYQPSGYQSGDIYFINKTKNILYNTVHN